MGTVKKLYQDQLVGGSGSAGQEVYPVTSTLGVYDTDNNQLQGVLNKVTTNLGLFTCGTGASTATKTVSASKFVLMEGGSVKIKFTYANSAASPTLAIGTTAAKPIMFNGSAASASNSWGAGEIVEFFYDGTNWVGSSTSVSVSQNTSTGHTDITIGSTTTPVASVEEVSQLGQELNALYMKIGNLLENVTWVVGSLNKDTGEVAGSVTSYNCSDFVATEGNNKITFSKHRLTCFYDANKYYLNEYVDDGAVEENKTILIPQGAYYFRTVKSVTWDSMVASFGDTAIEEEYNFIKKSFNDLVINSKLNDCLRNVAKEPITTSNYTTYFSSLSGIGIDAIYHIVGINNIDASAPTTKVCFLINALIDDNTSWQIIFESGDNPNIFIRYKVNGNWGAWRNIIPINKTSFVVDVNGGGDYTSLTECLVYIRENGIRNASVHIKSGTYNIYNEMKAKFGNDYWTNFNYSTSRYVYGLPLYEGLHITGDNGVVLTCINDQAQAESYFSFFYAYNDGGAIIENIKMVGAKIRYCVHIEFSTNNGKGTYVVRGCSMFIDNSGTTLWHHAAGIGAGSGLYTNCVFENNDVHPIFDVAVVKKSAILWHNTAGANPSNKVIISGNYCDADSFVSVATSGTSTNGTPCLVSNNSMGGDLLVLNTQEGNINVMAWNNVVR